MLIEQGPSDIIIRLEVNGATKGSSGKAQQRQFPEPDLAVGPQRRCVEITDRRIEAGIGGIGRKKKALQAPYHTPAAILRMDKRISREHGTGWELDARHVTAIVIEGYGVVTRKCPVVSDYGVLVTGNCASKPGGEEPLE